MASTQPPPTFADVVLVDERTGQPKFNPIWLNWFLQLARTLDNAGGDTLEHNDLNGLQGGTAPGERYHLTQANASAVIAIAGLGTGLVTKTAAATYAAREIFGTADQVDVADGDGVSGDPVVSLSIGDLLTDVYTPTGTGVANVAAITTYPSRYVRTGSFAIVMGKVDIDATAAPLLTRARLSLPIASNLANDYELSGAGNAVNAATRGFAVLGDVANNEAEINFICEVLANTSYHYMFSYLII